MRRVRAHPEVMRMRALRGFRLVSLFTVLALGGVIAATDKPPRPDPGLQVPDYRAWSHVKSMVIHGEAHPLFSTFGGIHHVYANEKAFPSTSALKPFPNGSALVLVLFSLKDKDGAYTAGERKLTGMMVKDDGKYKSTGGWGFQAFGNDGQPLVYDGGTACFACHQTGAASTGFVFSRQDP
jgi:hypothetical protein